MTKPVVGFIGVGKMGLPMVTHLRAAGYHVIVCDPLHGNVEAARLVGCEAAETVGGCASQADILLSSLPNDVALAAVTSGPDGVFAHARPGMIYADTSTVSPAVSAEVAQRAALAGVPYVRATVSGNPVSAKAATLTVMASGPQHAYARVKPLLETFGKTHFYLGEGEQARVIKLVINLMIAGTAGLMAEALTLGEKGGLDWKQMLDVIHKSAAGSPMVGYKVPPLGVRDYSSTFSGLQMIKDLDLILGEGARSGVPLALTAQVRQMYEAVRAQGDGELDYIATVRLVERMAGLMHN